MTVILESAPQFDWMNAGTGLLGVVLGAALTYFVTYRFERRRVHDERLGRSYNLIFAVLKIADDLTKMETNLREGIARAEAAGVDGELWTKLTSTIGHPDPIVVPSEDLTVLALTGDVTLTTQVSETEAAHRIYITSFRTLDDLRNKFESFDLHTAIDGQTVTFQADQAQLVRAGPTIINLRTLSESLAADLPKAAAKAREVAARLGPRLKEHYGFKRFITLSFPDAEGAPNGDNV